MAVFHVKTAILLCMFLFHMKRKRPYEMDICGYVHFVGPLVFLPAVFWGPKGWSWGLCFGDPQENIGWHKREPN